MDVGVSAPADYFFVQYNLPLSLWDFTKLWQERASDYPTHR